MQMLRPNTIRGVLFDLDGTLLDTAQDLAYTFNQLRREHGLDDFSFAEFRPIATLGSKEMIRRSFGIEESHEQFNVLREKFFALYQTHLAKSTRFFPNMENVLDYLEQKHIPWGIVTNKLTRHTHELLQALKILHRPACIVCGDTLSTYKPNPAPILHACELIKKAPAQCVYIGDALTDVQASKAAGTKSLVALYGYLNETDDPLSWQADGYIHDPSELIDWLSKYLATE